MKWSCAPWNANPARRYQQVSEVRSNVEAITSTMPPQKPGKLSGSAPPATAAEEDRKSAYKQPVENKNLMLGWSAFLAVLAVAAIAARLAAFERGS